MKVTHLGDGEIRGEWYSIVFGRVGTFIFRKDNGVVTPRGARVIDSPAGFFEDDQFQINLSVRLGHSPINTENPFFPLMFGGYTYYKKGFSSRAAIVGGSYDFYTDQLAFEVGDKGWVLTGQIGEQSDLYLRLPSEGVYTIMQPYALRRFESKERGR